MTDAELAAEAAIDAKLERWEARATAHQRAGGAERGTSIGVVVLGIIGMWAALSLIMAEKQRLQNPDAALLCDVNPLIGCGKWIGTWQNEVFFGVSNSVFGLAFFAGITALGLVLLSGGHLGTWLWRLTTIAAGLGIVWILWFGYQSYVVEGSLCPYCVLTWLVQIPLFILFLGRSMQAGHWGRNAEATGSALVRNRWLILALIYLALAVFTVVWFWDQWALVF